MHDLPVRRKLVDRDDISILLRYISTRQQGKMMKASRYGRLILLGIALLGAGAVLAEETPSVVDPVQQREQIREQFQERMRGMTPEEQKLMRDSSADGRARMENSQRGQDAGMRGGYGRGYESRLGGGGRGMGGGGRGMGGGRNR